MEGLKKSEKECRQELQRMLDLKNAGEVSMHSMEASLRQRIGALEKQVIIYIVLILPDLCIRNCIINFKAKLLASVIVPFVHHLSSGLRDKYHIFLPHFLFFSYFFKILIGMLTMISLVKTGMR